MDRIHKGKVFFPSSMYIKKASKKFEVKVIVQKGPLRFRDKIGDGFVNFIQFIQMTCVFMHEYYDLHHMKEKLYNIFLIRKW
jgi:hypothetical protein